MDLLFLPSFDLLSSGRVFALRSVLFLDFSVDLALLLSSFSNIEL